MGRHQKGKDEHVHDWKSQGYDFGMKKTAWKCACGDETWTEPGKHPDRP